MLHFKSTACTCMPDKCNGETMIFNATDPGNPDQTTTVKPDPPTTKKPDGVISTENPDEVNLTEKPDDGSNSTKIPNSCILPQHFWTIVLAMVYSNVHNILRYTVNNYSHFIGTL